MKKTLEYLYIFTKLSTSFILLLCILVLGYFLYASYKNQEKSNNDQVNFLNKLNDNAKQLTKLSKKIEITDTTLDEIKKAIQKNLNTNNSEEISFLNKKIEELNTKLESISLNIQEIQSLERFKTKEIKINDSSNLILNKNKTELAKLIFFKFENNLDFSEELSMLQNLNNQKKQHIFEKINLIELQNFRGKELDFFLKENYNNHSSNFFTKSLMKFIAIQPSKTNIIKNNEINILNEISAFLDKKQYKSSYQKVIIINNHEKYFGETINQIKIAIEFEKLIQRVS